MQDLEADLTRCKQMQEAAAKCYWESKFDQSEELYRAALAVLETVYATDSANIATCLQGLGDSYYFQDKFGLALPYYKRLLASRERMVDTDASEHVTALFKLAKTYDKLGEYEECEQTYKKAAATAQKRLFLGHPLLTSLLEAYGKFLKRVKPGTEHGIEQQATLSREKYVDPELLAANILEGVGGEKSTTFADATTASGKKNKIWFSKSVSEDSEHWFVKLLLGLKGNPLKTFAFLLSPMILASLFLLVSVTYELVVDESPQNAIVAAGQIFQTADGHERISFSKSGAAIEQDGVSVTRPYTLLSNRWRELFFVFNNGGSEPWTVKNGSNLVTESGVTFLPTSDPTTKMVSLMAKLADQFYGAINSSSFSDNIGINASDDPKSIQRRSYGLSETDLRNDIKLTPYTNPFTGLYAVPTLVGINLDATRSHQLTQETFKSMVVNATQVSDLELGAANEQQAKPGAILCLLTYELSRISESRFYVFGVGNGNQLVPYCQTGKALFLFGGIGIAPTMSCPGAEPIGESRLIMTRRSRASLVESRRLLGWDLLLLIPFLFCTVALQAQFEAKKHSDVALQAKLSLLTIAVMIYMPFAMAYACFTIAVIAKAFD